MKNVYALIDFCIKVLLITNAWIILYLSTNDYLYFRFPPHLNEIFFRSGLGNPEPFEILLYIIFSVSFVGVIWFYFQFINSSPLEKKNRIKSLLIITKVIIFLFLLILFIGKLGQFPLAGDIFPYKLQYSKNFYIIFFLFYLASIIFVTIQVSILQRVFGLKKIFLPLVYSLIILLITVLVFNPKFSLPYTEASLFFGPVREILSGKTIFTNIPSQYGFLSVILFALFNKVTHINFIYLPILITIMYVLEYFICFYLIFKISKSISLSLLGFFSIITINYLAATYGPQASPIRWFPIFFVIFLFYKFRKIDNKVLLILLPFLSLWNIDSGIFLVLGYVFTLFVFFLAKIINLKRLISAGIYLGISTIITLIIIEAGHLLFGFQPVDFLKLYHSVQKNAVLGMLMVPIEQQTYFWLVMLIYFSSIIYFFRDTKTKIPEKHGIESLVILLSSNLMLFASIYYVGRSMPHELLTISTFTVLTVFLLIGLIYNQLPAKLQSILLIIVFLTFISFPAFSRKEYIAEKLFDKYHKILNGRIFASEIDETVQKKYHQEASIINNSLKENEVLIVSADDTYLFYLTGKKNLLDADPGFALDTKSEMDLAIKRAVRRCPEKIAVDCTLLKKCPDYKVLSERLPSLPLILGEVEKKCAIKYQPNQCTDQLCIAERSK